MKPEIVGPVRTLAVLAGLLAAVSTQADESLPQGYVMTVYSNAAHGEMILEGSATDAIAKLSRRQKARSKYLEGKINLCVAYAQAKQIEMAIEVCDLAIDVSAKEARRIERGDLFGRESKQVADTGRAIAITNRGVLYAIAGEHKRAKQMFEKARALQSKEESAHTNLLLLERLSARAES